MSRTKTRIAVATAIAALSAPALASDVYDDPTWPATDLAAPAITLRAQGGEANALRADPTFPETDSALPAIALVQQPDGDDRPDVLDPNATEVNYAIVLGAPERRVARR